MSKELFVDGICEIDDKTIQAYFLRFGSRITAYKSERHRATNSCCFAVMSFVSPHTVNAILRQRPHSVKSHSLFVKRILPPNTCSFTERLLPVSSLFVNNKRSEECTDTTLKNYFKLFGHITRFERDLKHDRLLIEYDDYDSVDRIFLNKDQLPNHLNIHKNILPRAQSAIEYHGTCRAKQPKTTSNEQKKRSNLSNAKYQDLLQTTIENLSNCKAQLKNKENDYELLRLEYVGMKEENEKLNRLLDQSRNACLSCKEHQSTIAGLQQTLTKLNERILPTQNTPVVLRVQTNLRESVERDIPVKHHHYSLSTRLNRNENTPIVTKQLTSRLHKQSRLGYQYVSVKSDEN